MTILFLTPTGHIGGAEAALLEVLAGLREAQRDWTLVLLAGSEGPLNERAAALGVRVHQLPLPVAVARLGEWAGRDGWGARARLVRQGVAALPQLLGYAWRLHRAIGHLGPQLIHSHGVKMHLLGGVVRPRIVPLVWHWHDYVTGRPWSARIVRHAAHRLCSTVIANSASVAADVRAHVAPALPVRHVWNAVDLDRFSPDGPVLDLDGAADLPPISASRPIVRVGLVATFARWKGHETFLRAMALVPASTPVRGYVVGGPLYETAGSQISTRWLHQRIAELDLKSRVGCTGFLPDVAPALRALDIVVHASTEPEPFGLVVAEAMACGRAVVTSGAGGVRELVTPPVDAELHDPGDAPSLAHRIMELAADRACRTRLGHTARQTAERQFTRARLTREIMAAYATLPDRSRRRSPALRQRAAL